MEGIGETRGDSLSCTSHIECDYPRLCKKKDKNKEGKDIYVDIKEGEKGECVDYSGYVPPPTELSLELFESSEPVAARDTCLGRWKNCFSIGRLKSNGKTKKKIKKKTKRRTNKKLKKTKKHKRKVKKSKGKK